MEKSLSLKLRHCLTYGNRQVMSKVEQMQKLFSKCPICKSEEGYTFSPFYPHVECKSCKAEWALYEDDIELMAESADGLGKELLGKKYGFEFWRDLKVEPGIDEKTPLKEFKEKVFAPMDYLGGHTDYKKRAIGYILLKRDSISYIAEEGSLNKMNLEIPLEQFKGFEVRTEKEISALDWFLYGSWAIIFQRRSDYLVLTYEDKSGILQHMVFDFHNDKKVVRELIASSSLLKKEVRAPREYLF